MNTHHPSYYTVAFWLAVSLSLAMLGSCKKDDPVSYPLGSNEGINQWVLDSMRVYYYWERQLPNRPDLSPVPLDFFAGIRYTGDRFSELVHPNRPDSYQQTLSGTFGMDLLAVESSSGVELFISLVIPGSEAAVRGLVRGQQVLSVNGILPDAGNVEQLVASCISSGKAALEIEGLASPVQLVRSWISEDPVHVYKLLGDGPKIGYLFYNRFDQLALPPLLEAFAFFRQEAVRELIIDLRYNSGGDVSVAALLAALVAPVSGTDVFAEYRGNSRAGTKQNTFDKELAYIQRSVTGLEAHRLPLSRIYLLTGKHTVSAAELLVNNLASYINVVQIGGQTHGKDMAAFVISNSDPSSPSSGWILHPLVYKLYNASGKGEYANGLVPHIPADEWNVLPLRPLGDEGDPLVAAALADIKGLQNKALSTMQRKGSSPAVVLLDSRTAVSASASVPITRW